MAERCFWSQRGGVLALLLLCLASCEGEHRPYPTNLLRQGDASSDVVPEDAEPALTPVAGTSSSETIGDGTRLPTPDTSTTGTSASAPRPDASKTAGDAGAAATSNACDCSNNPATPLCKTATNASAAPTCVECLTNTDCVTAAAPRCDAQAGRCSGCRGNGDCSTIPGKPICRADDGQCVKCAVDADCTSDPAGPRCNTDTNTCSQCVVDSDCLTPTASRCGEGRCQPCVNDIAGSHCGHVASGNIVLGVCDTSGAAGECVQCTGTQSAACGASVCNSLTRGCTPFAAGSAGLCNECLSDAHCSATQRCVLETFGLTTLGYECFPMAQNGTCPLTPFSGLTSVNTIDGAIADVCLLRRTTCAAFEAFSLQSCVVDTDCGESNLADGRCLTGSLGTRCSIPCSNGADCPSNDDRTCLGACVFD
jgi:hypothetical protein